MGNLLRRVMSWCVPDKALRWFAHRSQWICPRCSHDVMVGHSSSEPIGMTCERCGWVRYWDDVQGRLVDAVRQPELATHFDTNIPETATPITLRWER